MGSLASTSGTSATMVAKGSGHFTSVPDTTLGRSVPVRVARSLSSGHLNLSQPTGSCANAGAAANTAVARRKNVLMKSALLTDIAQHGSDVRLVPEPDITERLVHSHHDAGRLDDGVSRFALFELEIVHRLIGDRSGNGLTADVNPNMGCGGTLFHVGDLTFEVIARAKFHENVLSID